MAKKKSKSISLDQIRPEILVFRGRLHPDQRFELGRSYSTHDVRRLPEDETPGFRLELVDEHESTINRAPVSVMPVKGCEAGGERYARVLGYVGLAEGAEKLRFYRDDILIENLPIPEKPTLSLRGKSVKVGGKGRVDLALRYSAPNDGAYMQVIYQWGERAWRVIGFYDPAEKLLLDISQLPSGRACRFLVLYSNGLRSVAVATNTFRRPIRGGRAQIHRPLNGAVFAPWVPIDFEGLITAPEGTEFTENDYVWRLNGEIVYRGITGSLENLAEGEYTLTLNAGETKNKKRALSAKVQFKVKKPKKYAGTPARDWDELES